MLPPGFCWGETGKVEKDPDEHVQEAVQLVFTKFRELGSARQVFLWLRDADIKMPVVRRNVEVYKLIWKAPAYHTVVQILHKWLIPLTQVRLYVAGSAVPHPCGDCPVL
jgi:hypothetical protein